MTASRQLLVTGATATSGRGSFRVSRPAGTRVTLDQMLGALVHAVENPPSTGEVEIVDVTSIQRW